MDTCVLLPPEFSLVMCLPDDDIGSIFDLSVTLWANATLSPGTNFDPEEGEAVLDTLECFSTLHSKNVRFEYGCEEEIVLVEGRKVRHCNWVRFLRNTELRQHANLETRKSKGRTVFTVTKTIQPNEEILCYFQSSSPSRIATADYIDYTTERKHEDYSDDDKENGVKPHTKSNHTMTPTIPKKEKRKSISMFHNTPVRKPLQDFLSPEAKRDAPCFSSPLSDGVADKSITAVTNTSPSNASDTTNTDTSPHSLAAKEHSPISEISAGTSPLRMSDTDQIPFQSSPPDEEFPKMNAAAFSDPPSHDTEYENKLGGSSECVEPYPANEVSTYLNRFSHQHKNPNGHSPMPETTPRANIYSSPGHTPHLSHTYNRIQNHEVESQTYSSKTDFRNTPNTSLPYRLFNASVEEEYLRKSDIYRDGTDVAHIGTVVRRREKTWLPCDMCGKKFDRPSLLKRHIRTHTGEKPHACDVCGKAFSTSSSLNTHRRIHSGEKPHQCQTCGKRFTASSNLYYHRMTHKKEKPHKCTLCAKSFPTPGDLRSHMYVHNGSWPFKCTVCNRGFSKQTNLKNHMLLHSGDKPHCCPICDKKFALQCNLKTHIKTHEEDGDTSCSRCGIHLGDNPSSSLCHKCITGNRELVQEVKTLPTLYTQSQPGSPFYTGAQLNSITPTLATEHTERMQLFKQQAERQSREHYGMTQMQSLPMHLRNIMSNYMQSSPWGVKQ